MPEFAHQDYVKYIDNVGAHNYSCALNPLSMLNTGSITTFLPTSVSTFLESKIKETFKEGNETVKKKFFPQCLLPDLINLIKG